MPQSHFQVQLPLKPLKTSPEYTQAMVYGKDVFISKIKSSSIG